ncbi:MAG: hypothetical protein ACRDCE_15145 [Cetobacterium sp.]|uniref:hypothetical protein n=1 Tax=Cetobacterium sp. TaxID=2071632 RepID=UPI003EE57EE4
MTDRIILGTVSAVLTGIITSAVIGGVVMWRDVALMKEQIIMNKEELALRAKSADQFETFLNQMERSIAVQTESVNGLKKAVDRLEQAVFTLKEKPL